MAKKKNSAAGNVLVKYVGDGTRYVPGVPADPDIEQEFDAETAAGLVGTGLYSVVGAAPAAAEPEPTEDDGSGQEVSE